MSGEAGTSVPARRVAIVGDATLTGQCVEVARGRGLDVVVVATEHPHVRAQASEFGVPVVASADVVRGALDVFEFDVLLSIANLRVLPESVLRRARYAINFHDGPLPALAGLNVTTWAILAGAETHAVTWHLMTDDVDGGAVVTTESFDIDGDDTAFSLNARCYEAAMVSFPRVVDALVSGRIEATPQPAGERRTCKRFERPALIIDPARHAVATVREIRACSLGHAAPNSIGASHLIANGQVVVVTGARIAESVGAPAGTVTIDDGALRLAATGGDIVIDGIESVDGRQLLPADALATLGLTSGSVVPSPAPALADAFAALDPALARHEPFWRTALAGMSSSARPWFLERPTSSPAVVRRDLPRGATPDDVAAAIAAWSRRALGAAEAVFAVADESARSCVAALFPLAQQPVVRIAVDDGVPFGELCHRAARTRTEALDHGPFLSDLVGRDPVLRGTVIAPHLTLDTRTAEIAPDAHPHAPSSTLRVGVHDGRLECRGPAEQRSLERFADQIVVLLAAGLAAPGTPIGELPMLGADEVAELDSINRTEITFDRDATIDELFRRQAERTPAAPALTFGGETLTYEQLTRRVDAIASQLAAAGVGRNDRVGIALERSADMVASVLATLACGAAYVPLDPTYPPDRISLMIEDSGLRVLVAEPGNPVVVGAPDGVVVIQPTPDRTGAGASLPVGGHIADDLAYVIYTSGSTGTPKGVMLEHRNVVNFFAAMDAVIDHDPPGVWLAVTSLSFDISVLELLWTVTRGFHVVVKPDSGAKAMRRHAPALRPMSMSLFYFAAGEDTAADGYRLLLDSARWADAQGLEAVWTPERHFHAFGGAYPNPSVIGAAIAAVTDRIRIRAGSVVAPLHSPARIAEEWAVVDNLSGGRVDISFAAGWQPNDFVLNPDAYATARESLPSIVDTVRRLWRGESVDMAGPDGAMVPIRTLPRPIQPELPVWLTSAGSTPTFERAGAMGVNLLTHLLGQSIEQLAENVAAYRRAWRDAGHPGEGRVTLMLHTYLHDDADEARRVAHEPMKRYLGTAAGLLRNMASAFPVFAGSGKDADEAFASLTPDELDQLLEMAAARYLHTSGLFGTVDDAAELLARCSAAGADEIACLVDFGIDTDAVLGSLPLLGAVHNRLVAGRAAGSPAVSEAVDALDVSFAQLVADHSVTHLQCTPSLATMLVADPADRAALGTIPHVMLGGEALPTALASELTAMLPGRLTNMYGPTETTIWSLVHDVTSVPSTGIPIGRPIGNNTVFVLDPAGRRLPIGAFGELHIGGDGVARGYHERHELTAQRFVDRPGMGRVYATGDVVRFNGDGIVEFAGRSDHQVKIRGHRIELGEIETVIDGHPDIVQSVVVAHRPPTGDPRLVAFVVTSAGVPVDEALVRSSVGERLPEAYVPTRVVRLDGLPLTPNGKTDRSRLEADVEAYLAGVPDVELATPVLDDDTEQLVAEVWQAELRRPVGPDDNFFEIGGNSLLAVTVFRSVCERTGAELALTDVFRFPTIRTFAAHLRRVSEQRAGGASGPEAAASAPSGAIDRGAMRRRALARRGG